MLTSERINPIPSNHLVSIYLGLALEVKTGCSLQNRIIKLRCLSVSRLVYVAHYRYTISNFRWNHTDTCSKAQVSTKGSCTHYVTLQGGGGIRFCNKQCIRYTKNMTPLFRGNFFLNLSCHNLCTTPNCKSHHSISLKLCFLQLEPYHRAILLHFFLNNCQICRLIRNNPIG